MPLLSSTILINVYLAYSLKEGDASGSGKHCAQGPADLAAKRRIQLPSLHLEVLESESIIVRTDDSRNKPAAEI